MPRTLSEQDPSGLYEPTADECSNNKQVYLDAYGNKGYAIWFPQLGGYWGKAVAIIYAHDDKDNDDDCCIDVWVWHDGDFPFEAEGGPPSKLHLCSATQFINFGKKLQELQQQTTTASSQGTPPVHPSPPSSPPAGG